MNHLVADCCVTAAAVVATIDWTGAEAFAARWGVPMLLVVLVVTYGIGAARRKEKRDAERESAREKRDEEREARLIEGFDAHAAVTGRLERAVTRQTAVILAVSSDADEERIDRLVDRMTAQEQLCDTCPLRSYPTAERSAVAARAAYCARAYPSCPAAAELAERERQVGLL